LTQGKAKRKARKLASAAEENEFVFVKYQEDNKTSGFYNPNGQHQPIARAWNL
jgi:phosphoribosylformylglycinamidine (FGAM) synthase-like amidotransferase family enzyme